MQIVFCRKARGSESAFRHGPEGEVAHTQSQVSFQRGKHF
jgi:hypothetical protein